MGLVDEALEALGAQRGLGLRGREWRAIVVPTVGTDGIKDPRVCRRQACGPWPGQGWQLQQGPQTWMQLCEWKGRAGEGGA